MKKLHKQMNCFKVSLWHLKEQFIFLNSITTYLVFNEKINYLFLCFCGLATKKKYNIKIKIFAMVTRLKSPKFDILRYF